MISHIWNLIYGTNEPFYGKETNGPGVAKGEGEGVGWNGNLGLIDSIIEFAVHKQRDSAL